MYEPYHQSERDDYAAVGCLLIVLAFLIILVLFIIFMYLLLTGRL